MIHVTDEAQYLEMMAKIEALMQIGEEHLTEQQSREIETMAIACEAWETIKYGKITK